MKDRSIRFKLTLWFSLVLIIIVSFTLLAVLSASQMVLRRTVRDYLISTVEENVDNIKYVTSKDNSSTHSYIPYSDGYLQIDLDYMNVVNDVHTALYTADGTMLYGDNPLSKKASDWPLGKSHTWSAKVNGVRYDLYDRKLNIDIPEGSLWIRGVVSETKSVSQLWSIIRISLVILPELIIISIISGYFMAGRMLSPIRKIEKTAAVISSSDKLNERIEVGKNKDEIGRLALVFNRMLDQLEQLFQTQRQFTSDASHELRTPTSVILAQSEYILEKDRSAEEYKEAFEVVYKQGKRMNSLISDMLDYTRIEQGASRYSFEQINLSDLVSDLTEQMRITDKKGITLSTDIQSDVIINGNADLLTLLVQNLISNAYRYGKENGNILVELKEDNGKASLSVKDDGIGISPEDKEKIFNRFFRSDASRSIHGTGLGLPVVKMVADLHNAQIEVESELNKGSAFKIIF
ncbi:MAG: HAMP domain-containing histidine kinase [Clostridiales bacterium]|nr:HAMP domain-containing histidine kinase [Clostridiales bacterium]